jgi:hypothetical protein
MVNQLGYARAARMCRLAFPLAVATAALAGALATPAYADNRPNGKGNAAHAAPAGQQVAERGRGREEHRGGGGGHYGGYRGDHDVYYGAPPIVYPPPGYYQQQPGTFLNFIFPVYP